MRLSPLPIVLVLALCPATLFAGGAVRPAKGVAVPSGTITGLETERSGDELLLRLTAILPAASKPEAPRSGGVESFLGSLLLARGEAARIGSSPPALAAIAARGVRFVPQLETESVPGMRSPSLEQESRQARFVGRIAARELPKGAIELELRIDGAAEPSAARVVVDLSGGRPATGLGRAWQLAEAEWLGRLGRRAPERSFFSFARERLRVLAGEAPSAGPSIPPGQPRPDERLYETMTGALALQESLQLDRMRTPPARGAAPSIPVDSIAGVEVKSHPWEEMLGGKSPEVEPAAALVPDDWWYFRFVSPAALRKFFDRLDDWGEAPLALFEPAGRDFGVRDRLERRILLGSSWLSQTFGSAIVGDVVLAGSDPYLREGSDLTVVFQLRSESLFDLAVGRRLTEARRSRPDLEEGSETFEGIRIDRATTKDGEIRAYRAKLEGFSVHSTSPVAIRRVVEAWKGERRNLASAGDFRYMRSLHPLRGDPAEDGFLFLSDPFLRRLTGPALRIGEKRRIEAMTSMEMLGNAALLHAWLHPAAAVPGLETMVTERLLEPRWIETDPEDRIDWSPERFEASSRLWGRRDALVPLLERPIERVTEEEKRDYELFRDRYRQYWRRWFDPIGLSFRIDRGLSFSLTVLPLIEESTYARGREMIGGKSVPLEPERRGAPTPFHLAAHLNPEGSLVRNLETLTARGAPGDPKVRFDWLGQRVELWIEDFDPAAAKMTGDSLTSLFRMPIVFAVEVGNPIALAGFLVALRKEVETAAPNLVEFEPESPYQGFGFTRIGASAAARAGDESGLADLAIHYGSIGKMLYFSTSLASLHGIVDASKLPPGKGPEPAEAAFGAARSGHAALRFDLSGIRKLRPSFEGKIREAAEEVDRRNRLEAWLLARTVGVGPGARVPAEKVLGYRLVPPLGGEYRFDPIRDEVPGSAPPSGLPSGSPAEKLLRSLGSIRATIELSGERLHTELAIREGGR